MALKPEAVMQILASLKRRADYEFVLGRLTSAEWIAPLAQAGLFRDPPASVKSGDSVMFPSWPESAFLARVSPQAPALVADILLALPETDNPRIHEDIVDAALSMPCSDAARVAKREIGWIETQPYLYLGLPQKVAKLIGHLAACGDRRLPLHLLRVLFAVFPDSRASEASIHSEPRGRMDSWDYGRQLDDVIDQLSPKYSHDILPLLSDLLEQVIRFRRPPADEGTGEDYSFIWQRELTEKRAHENGIDHALALATTRVALTEVQREGVHLDKLVESLESRPFAVFKRIALLSLSHAPDSARELGRVRVLDASLFNNPSALNEYAQLSHRWFGSLGESDQEIVLSWIAKGRDQEKIRARYREDGLEVSDTDLERWDNQWRRDRLAPIADQLPHGWHERFNELVNLYGSPVFDRHLSSEIVFNWGEQSPKSVDDLRVMSVDDIVAFLMMWVPLPESGAEYSPTRGGLARVVAESLKERSLEFTAKLEQFASVPRFYIARIFDAIREAVRSGLLIDWAVTLRVARRYLRSEQETAVHSDESSESLDRWIKRDVAALVQEGLESTSVGPGVELREAIWALLIDLVEDENPTADEEIDLEKLPMDPLTVSMNTVRGQALHAIIRYALWLKRPSAMSPSEPKLSDIAPEVFQVLDRHLDLSVDGVSSIRAVYGQAYPRFVFFDHDWARSNAASIFPIQEELRTYWNASWESFLRYNGFHPTVFDTLQSQYRFAVELLEWDTSDEDDRAAVALAQHLMVAMWQGKLEINDETNLLRDFFSLASTTLRGTALEFVGASLSRSADSPPQQVLGRIQALWNARRTSAENSGDLGAFKSELIAFGWWVTAEFLDPAWRLANLEWTLRKFGTVQAESGVLESLAELSRYDALAAIRCARLLILGSQRTDFLGAHQGLRTLADEIHRLGDEASLVELEHLVNELGAQGFFHAKTLLSASLPLDLP